MHVGPQKRSDIILAIAGGMAISKALEQAGYSPSTAAHKSGLTLSGPEYMSILRQYCATVAGKIGREPISDELKLVENSSKWTEELTEALRKIREVYNEMRPDESDESAETPATKKPRSLDSLLERTVRESQAPKYEERVRQLVKRGEAISTDDLGYLGRALLQQDLISPGKDRRTRLQAVRAALEVSGSIGAGAAELHLHQHQHNHGVLPATVQRMLLSKMAELSAQDNMLQLSEPLPTPPEPLPGQTFRAESDPSAAEEAAQALLDRKASSLQNSLTQLQDQARQGAQVIAKENELKMIHEMGRR
jgi:hypothetical protein